MSRTRKLLKNTLIGLVCAASYLGAGQLYKQDSLRALKEEMTYSPGPEHEEPLFLPESFTPGARYVTIDSLPFEKAAQAVIDLESQDLHAAYRFVAPDKEVLVDLAIETPDYSTARRALARAAQEGDPYARLAEVGPDGTLRPLTYDQIIEEAIDRYITPVGGKSQDDVRFEFLTHLPALIEQESGYDPAAISSAGARGATQIMPGTCVDINTMWKANLPEFDAFRERTGTQGETLTESDCEDILHNAAIAIDDGAAALWHFYTITNGDMDKALAAYNAGPGRLPHDRWKRIPETRTYVRNITQMAQQNARRMR